MLDDVFTACTYLPWKPFKDTEALNELQDSIGIISNWDTSLPDKLKSFFTIEFSPIIGSEKIKICKPDPRIFEFAINEVGFKPEEIVFVGDSLKLDIEPALSMGIDAILVDRYNDYPYYKGKKISSFSEIKQYI